MKLTAENVDSCIKRVLFNPEEVVNGKPVVEPVMVEGCVRNFGFHPTRLQAEKENVRSMLAELPAAFQPGQGDGMSFLNACMDKDGVQWGEHTSVEALMCLGIALKLVRYCLPRGMWSALPGGMPYFGVVKQD